jgi:predicted enzyme related to lactoylglutathione lyase
MREDGKIDYLELRGGDLARCKRFYGDAFGWTFTDHGPSYASFEGAGLDGGLQGDGNAASAAPLVVLFARDLEAVKARVETAGGTITLPPFDFPGGRRFHFRDPAGNELAVWSER